MYSRNRLVNLPLQLHRLTQIDRPLICKQFNTDVCGPDEKWGILWILFVCMWSILLTQTYLNAVRVCVLNNAKISRLYKLQQTFLFLYSVVTLMKKINHEYVILNRIRKSKSEKYYCLWLISILLLLFS